MILLLTVRLLDSRFHGLADNGASPNWPPSCFRLFQAIVAGNAVDDGLPSPLAAALRWLESLPPPIVTAPRSKPGQVVRTYVLNNADSRCRTPKFLRPTLLQGEPKIEFAWTFDQSVSDAANHADVLMTAMRRIRAFGWGIDLACGSGRTVGRLDIPTGHRETYFPLRDRETEGIEIRVPCVGSLDSLQQCHAEYRARLGSKDAAYLESGTPLFSPWPYSRMASRPHAVFKLVAPNGEDLATYPHAKLMHIAAMTRSLAIRRCLSIGMDGEFVNRFVRGKNEPARDDHKQLSYVPLPSIGHEHADARVRNVMLVAPFGMDEELARVVRAIDGQTLIPERDEGENTCEAASVVPDNYRAKLQSFEPPKDKFIARCHLTSSPVWETVTPIILDEHAKKVNRKHEATGKIEKVWNHDELICKALKRAGIETPCRFTWQSIPFVRNCLTAHKYIRDEHAKDGKRRIGYYLPKRYDGKTVVHVRITFDHPVPGPITLGAGRHCGFGLMAAAT